MGSPRQKDNGPNNIAFIMVAVVVLAILIIAGLTITAIWLGPPTV